VNEAARSSIRGRARACGEGTSRKSVHAKGLARGGADEDHDGCIDNQVRRPGGPVGTPLGPRKLTPTREIVT